MNWIDDLLLGSCHGDLLGERMAIVLLSRTRTRALRVHTTPAWPVWPQGSGTELRASCACSGVQACAERADSRPYVLHAPRCACGSLLASSTTVRDGLQGLLWKHARRGNTQGGCLTKGVVVVAVGLLAVIHTTT